MVAQKGIDEALGKVTFSGKYRVEDSKFVQFVL
jgi:hypothetical protein